MADWQAIRAEFEQGISQRSLALKYGTTQASISRHATKEHWCITPRIIPVSVIQETAEELSERDLVQKALNQLAVYLDGEGLIGLNQHKLFADALSQYIKLKMLFPSDQPTASGIAADLLPFLEMHELTRISELQEQIDALLEIASARKLEQTQNIKSIHRAS